MKITVKMFALAKQLVQADEVCVTLPDQATLADLKRALREQHPALDSLAAHWMFAIDGEYAGDADQLHEQADVACIPPVSGG
ncbi:MAG: MoaD/ThiS family protein [Pirellulaceae bacterium]|nr:MoaD/ThiS family protein [Pirellulaceae bacterium]MDP7020648.1 MoaD/ThiS family protein [Pirellulaceae bacterium]